MLFPFPVACYQKEGKQALVVTPLAHGGVLVAVSGEDRCWVLVVKPEEEAPYLGCWQKKGYFGYCARCGGDDIFCFCQEERR